MEAVRPATSGDDDALALLVSEALDAVTDVRGGAGLIGDIARIFCVNDGTVDAVTIVSLHTRSDAVFLVGTLDAVVLGFLVAHVEPAGMTICAVYVTPGAREVSIGGALVGAAIEAADALGCNWIDALARPGDAKTKQLFESLGLKARQLVLRRDLSE